MLVDVADCVFDGPDPLGLFIRYSDAELVLDLHDKFGNIQRVGGEVIQKRAIETYLLGNKSGKTAADDLGTTREDARSSGTLSLRQGTMDRSPRTCHRPGIGAAALLAFAMRSSSLPRLRFAISARPPGSKSNSGEL